MLKEFLQYLVGRSDPLATVIWTCDPLVVVDANEEVIFADNADVEFTPADKLGIRGQAKCLKPSRDGDELRISVEHRMNRPVSVDVHIRSRGGFTLSGTDAAGEPVTWYVAKAADDYLRALQTPTGLPGAI